MVNVVGKINQRQKDHDYRNNTVQESLTQLNKMRDERLGIFYRHVYGLSLDEGEDSTTGAAAFFSASINVAEVFSVGSGVLAPVDSGFAPANWPDFQRRQG